MTPKKRFSVLGEPLGDLAKPIYLREMRRCLPTNAIADALLPGCWRAVDFQSEIGDGTMLFAGQTSQARPITYPLKRTGWHALWLGVHSWYPNAAVGARLTKDSAVTRFEIVPRSEPNGSPPSVWIEDMFWQYADLTDQDAHFSIICTPVADPSRETGAYLSQIACVAYIKLVPLTDEQVAQIFADRAPGSPNRRNFVHMDAFSCYGRYLTHSADDVRRELEPLRHGDFSRLYWEFGAGDLIYANPSPAMSPGRDHMQSHFRSGDLYNHQAWVAFKNYGIDPLRVAIDHAHDMGLEFHATYRPAGFRFLPPLDEWTKGGLYDRFPQWRGVARDGSTLPRLSYAYEGLRQKVIEYFSFVATYPIDGVCVAFNRRCPLMDYEPPLVEGFINEFHKDPRDLDERDPQWLTYRATHMTRFMQDLRRAMTFASQLDVRQGRPGKPPAISAIVLATEAENLFNALDLRQWVRQGLVDTIIPYSSREGDSCSTWDTFTTAQESDYFRDLTKGTQTKLATHFLPRHIPAQDYLRRAAVNYAAGVEHLFFWDADQRSNMGRAWQAIRRLGHREDILASSLEIEQLAHEQGTFVRQLGEWDLRMQCPG